MRNLFVVGLLPILAVGAVGSETTLSTLQDLAANAPEVLADGPQAVEATCRVDRDDQPLLETVAAIDVALVAVAAVLDPALMSARNACLSALGQARIEVLVEAG